MAEERPRPAAEVCSLSGSKLSMIVSIASVHSDIASPVSCGGRGERRFVRRASTSALVCWGISRERSGAVEKEGI